MRQIAFLALFACGSAFAADDDLFAFAQADRIEYQAEESVSVWDLQGWYGGDYHRLWWKTEGEFSRGSVDDAELQLLYGRAFSAFFDFQFGLRYEDLELTDQVSAVIGLQGLVPYSFEVDIALFVTEDGDALFRGEFERDWLLTQRWVLQPRIEINAAFDDAPDRLVASGFTDTAIELRLRYEISRKFAPYLGISWQRALGDTGDLVEAAGGEKDLTTLVAGLRFWF